MPLFATTALTGPNGEQINPDQRIPAGWAVDDPFVVECIEHGFIVSRDEDQPMPLPATAPSVGLPTDSSERKGARADVPPAVDPYSVPVEVGGVGTQTREDS